MVQQIKPVKGKRIRIGVLAYIADLAGCGTIRVILPSILMNQFNTPHYQFQQFFLNHFVKDLVIYNGCSHVIFQRSATDKHVELIKLFKTKIKPLTRASAIYEVDDLLLDIPKWNYAADFYANKIQHITECMKQCDGMIVSSDKLRQVYLRYNPNINIVPNHLCKFYWAPAGDPPSIKIHDRKKPRIIYPGSSNHFAQKNSKVPGGDFGTELINFVRKTTDIYDWHFIGGWPGEITDLKDSGAITHHGWQVLYNYPGFLKSLEADLAIAPLMKCLFNECKSNIKVLEYSAIGVPGVYTNIHPYYKCHQRADTDEEMISKIEQMVKTPDLRVETWKRDYASVKDQLFWEDNGNLLDYFNQHMRLFGKEIVLD